LGGVAWREARFYRGKHRDYGRKLLIVDVNRDFAAATKSRMIVSRRKHWAVYFEGVLDVIGGYNGISSKDWDRIGIETEQGQRIEDLLIYLKGMAVVGVKSLRSLYAVGGDSYDYTDRDLKACIFQYHSDDLTCINCLSCSSRQLPTSSHASLTQTPHDLCSFVQSAKLYELDLVSIKIHDCEAVLDLTQ
jgi:hypothetical protein